MLLAVNINLVAFSHFLGDLVGQVFTLFVLTVCRPPRPPSDSRSSFASSANRGTIAVEDVQRDERLNPWRASFSWRRLSAR